MPYPKSMSIIPADQTISVEGESYPCKFSAGETVHAIQWFADHGQIEVANGPAHGFANADYLDPYLAAWRKGKAEFLRSQHAERKTHFDQMEGILASHAEALDNMKKEVARLETELADVPIAASTPEDEENLKARTASIRNARDRLSNQVKMTTGEIATLQSTRDALGSVVAQLDTRAAQAEHEASEGG